MKFEKEILMNTNDLFLGGEQMDISGGSIKIFGCNGNKSLAEHIASDLGLALGKSEIGKFSDGEISVRINETVRGADVFIVQPTSNPVNDNLILLMQLRELLLVELMPLFLTMAMLDRIERQRQETQSVLSL